jgi:hypothetical protein
MATNVSNVTSHFPDAENGFTTTLASTISSGATTVPLNSVAGYTNGQPAVFVVDPSDPTKKQTFTGIIDTSGIQVTSVVWTAGTNQTHAGGATVVDYATATHIAMMSKGILVHADQDGTLKAGAVDNANVLASDVVTTAKILDANVTTAKVADDAITSAKINFGGAGAGIWWEEIGRTTLSVAGDTITVSSLPARRYLQVIISVINTGGTINTGIQFNNDTGNNYARRISISGAADITATSQSSISLSSTDASPRLLNLTVMNVASSEKLVQSYSFEQSTAGAGNAPSRIEGGGKWANTSAQISRIDVINSGTGDYAIGSEVVVLGHD